MGTNLRKNEWWYVVDNRGWIMQETARLTKAEAIEEGYQCERAAAEAERKLLINAYLLGWQDRAKWSRGDALSHWERSPSYRAWRQRWGIEEMK